MGAEGKLGSSHQGVLGDKACAQMQRVTSKEQVQSSETQEQRWLWDGKAGNTSGKELTWSRVLKDRRFLQMVIQENDIAVNDNFLV